MLAVLIGFRILVATGDCARAALEPQFSSRGEWRLLIEAGFKIKEAADEPMSEEARRNSLLNPDGLMIISRERRAASNERPASCTRVMRKRRKLSFSLAENFKCLSMATENQSIDLAAAAARLGQMKRQLIVGRLLIRLLVARWIRNGPKDRDRDGQQFGPLVVVGNRLFPAAAH